MPKRLSRKERQQRTRSSLLRSAAKAFACKGMDRASIDEIAEDAGYTKGAFYANFKSKEELFLAMLDERFADRIAEIDRAAASDDEPEEQLRQAGLEFMHAIGDDVEWERLFFEFSAYAARNGEFREELVTRYRTLRARLAEVVAQRARELDVELPVSPEQIARMIVAMANGIALEKLLDPEDLPDELYVTMLTAVMTGLGVAAAERAAQG
jgi:AcrR family transcriptional regulator